MKSWQPSQVDAFQQSESSPSKTCWIQSLSFIGPKCHSCLVEDDGNTWNRSPINFLGPPHLPCVFNNLFDPCMYFWKWQWTHIMAQHQFIKCIKIQSWQRMVSPLNLMFLMWLYPRRWCPHQSSLNIVRFVPSVARDEREKALKFFRGLNARYREVMGRNPPATYLAVVEEARGIESEIQLTAI